MAKLQFKPRAHEFGSQMLNTWKRADFSITFESPAMTFVGTWSKISTPFTWGHIHISQTLLRHGFSFPNLKWPHLIALPFSYLSIKFPKPQIKYFPQETLPDISVPHWSFLPWSLLTTSIWPHLFLGPSMIHIRILILKSFLQLDLSSLQKDHHLLKAGWIFFFFCSPLEGPYVTL